jgi:hypothetical protein
MDHKLVIHGYYYTDIMLVMIMIHDYGYYYTDIMLGIDIYY